VRKDLKPRRKPYYRMVRGGAFPVHLGYYRQMDGRPGTWNARRYVGEQRYETTSLGVADDDPRLPGDGVAVLTFDQAQRAAVAWADKCHAAECSAAMADVTPTVRRAIETYIAARKARDPKTGADAALRLAHHVLSAPLAELSIAAITENDLMRWRNGLRRGGRARSAAPLAAGTLARLFNDFRAALRAAAIKAKLSGDALTTITAGCKRPEGASRPRPKQVLSDDDVRRLVEAADAVDVDFGALVLVLAVTGARLDQIARATVADFQPEMRRLMVPLSRKGRGTKPQTHAAVPLPDDVVDRLRAFAAGRAGHEPLLLRWYHRQVAGDRARDRLPAWERVERRPWRSSSELTRPWKVALAAARLPADLVPYALRHSSIVRGLRAGLPVRLVAAVHDTSVSMVERHYGAFIVDVSEDLLRRAVMPFTARRQKPSGATTMPVHGAFAGARQP
jgi:integrase